MPTPPDRAPHGGSSDAAPGLSGRRSQAARNDAVILEAARAVFLRDPKAPIAAVAERAKVGISALYRRYDNKEALLRQVCHDGLRQFVAEAEQAVEAADAWHGLTTFLRRVVAADVHSLTVHLAGSFTPTPEMQADAARSGELLADVVERARAGGRLRPDVDVEDVGLLLETCAAIRLRDARRTGELRQRHLSLLIAGLGALDAPTLPGPPPTAAEMSERWRR